MLVALALLSTLAAEPVRVAEARTEHEAALRTLFAERKVRYPARALYLRVFKQERQLELWAGDGVDGALVLIKSYPICASSGSLGPKRRQGDLQVPEGFYAIDKLNPTSSYHLSMHVDYPNQADRIAGRRGAAPSEKIDLGGDIMVHGACVTIGCIPIEDEPIEEVYLVVADAMAGGARAPIHIFPRRLDAEGLAELGSSMAGDDVKAFWRSLAPAYRAFEETRRVPRTSVAKDGSYQVAARP